MESIEMQSQPLPENRRLPQYSKTVRSRENSTTTDADTISEQLGNVGTNSCLWLGV